MSDTAWWSDPGVLIVLGVLAVTFIAAVTFIGASNRTPAKDPTRLFSPAQRQRLFELCGGRCEHKHPLWFRCSATATRADHVYPHSKGGVTELRNGQGLCSHHNLRKGAKIPSRSYLRRLAARRASYYPAGAQRHIDWRPGPS